MNPFPEMMLASSTSQQTKKKHAREKCRHYLSDHIIITNEYVNLQKPNNKYCFCLACHDLNFEKVKIINRKKLVKNYLKNCTHFIHKVGEREQADNILNNESLKKLRLNNEEVNENINNVAVVDSDSDDEIEDNEHIINVENWNEIIQRWNNMISEEEKDEIDIALGDNNLEQIINDTDHPAINNDAKWKLKTLFKDDIPTPAFIYDL
ncbi:2740_t:CDS:2 [Dentiscutata erythropus]|uniref:2740_t:CDS:1 n=1 Tax=Dentiscutata erythropus TaxID=1348616 RepID=A0A9N8Z332_9GLOM|nr:2740_t:CDS:2 [Dentiscutata erythropus]